MASKFFGNLVRGVKFDSERVQKDAERFKKAKDKNACGNTKLRKNPKIADLDFFGFDAAKKSNQPEKSHMHVRQRKISEDMVPSWAGNDSKKKNKKSKEGSKPRRKRKLSESAIEEEKLVEQERHQASLLLAPKTKKLKSKKKKQKKKKRSNSMVSNESEVTEKSEASEEEEEEEEEEDNNAVNIFHKEEAEKEKVHVMDSIKQKKKKSSTTSDKKKQKLLEEQRNEVALFRKQMNIHVEGTSIPNPIGTFEELKLKQQKIRKILLQNIENSEYKEPTPIQMQAIPSLLLRRDVLATAPTGSGKTAAFVIPILANLCTPQQEGIRCVVLAPTRELAVQIQAEFIRLSHGRKFHILLLSKATAATITSYTKNNMTVNHDILIATPLRLVHLIQQSQLDLSMVEMICLDEADRLFEMGFIEQIDEIFAACSNPKLQRAMFSATMLQGVEEMAQSILLDPIKISIGIKNAGASSIDQRLVFVGKEEGKIVAMKNLIQQGLQIPVLLFVQNKERANELYHELLYDGINVETIHADRTKEQRDQIIRHFRMGTIWVLICTDLMSRGMDFKAVNMIINYDFPQSAVSYIHRIGRTGRGGRKGIAVTFFTENDMVYLRSIANVMKLSGCEVPEWMLSLKKASVKKRKELLKAPPKRHRINTVSGYDLQKAHKRKQMKESSKQKKQQEEEKEEIQIQALNKPTVV